jgi:hypothetical protein
MSTYLQTMGMQSMPILSPMASVPSKKNTREGKARSLTISDGIQRHVTRETMLTQLNNRELTLILTDVSPYIVGSVITTKGKPVMAYSQNLTRQPHRTTTRNELRSIIAKLRAQPNILTEYEVQVCTDNLSVRYGHVNATGDAPWQLILNGSSLTITYLPLPDPVAADDISRQGSRPLLLDPHSTA